MRLSWRVSESAVTQQHTASACEDEREIRLFEQLLDYFLNFGRGKGYPYVS